MSALPGTTGRRRLYLMRHGHVDYFGPEIRAAGGDSNIVPLTELGRSQAAAAGKALSEVRFDRALSSGYPRTRTTAEIVLAAQGETVRPTLEEEPDLVEIHGRPQAGSAEAKATPPVDFPSISRDELAARMAYFFETADEPGARMFAVGELFADAERRAVEAVKRLLAEPGWHTSLIVAHEGINRLLLGWATQGGKKTSGLSACRSFEQDLACINVIDFDLVPAEGSEPGAEIQRTIIKAVNLTPYNYLKNGMNMTSLESIFAERD